MNIDQYTKEGIYIETEGTNYICNDVRSIETNESERQPINICWGINWSMYADTESLGVELVKKLMKDEVIKGSTYVEAMHTEYGIKKMNLSNPNFDKFTCEVSLINNEENEKIKDYYLKYISDKVGSYDNYVCVIVDDPDYEFSTSEYYTITVVVSGKERSFIINMGCAKEIYYNLEAEDVVKKLTL